MLLDPITRRTQWQAFEDTLLDSQADVVEEFFLAFPRGITSTFPSSFVGLEEGRQNAVSGMSA